MAIRRRNAVVEKDREASSAQEAREDVEAEEPIQSEKKSLHEIYGTRLSVLVIGTETLLFKAHSAARKRVEAYARRLQLTIICASVRADGFVQQEIAPDTEVIPTDSYTRLLWGFDAFRIARRVRSFEVVTAQDPFECGLIAWLIARTTQAKLHVQVHTDLFASAYATSSLNRIRTLIARFVLARADRIRVVSERIRDSVVREVVPRAPISVLPIFTDITRFKNAKPGELAGRFKRFNTKVVVISRLEREKNVILAIESFAKVAPEDACLIIVGEGSEKKRLQARVAYAGLSGRVFFQDWQDPAPYYALADLILFPSLYDGYGLVIIEALAAGKPVLATDVGVAGEAGAYIVEPKHFADALKEWFQRGDRIAELKNYPYSSFEEYVEKYCTDITGAKE